MTSQDKCCTIHPYFKVKPGQIGQFKELCGQFIEKSSGEDGCLYYGFSFDGDAAHCREGYKDASALLVHLENVGALIEKSLQIADITRLEVHGPKEELEKLKEALAPFNPQYFTFEFGFRK